MTDTEPNPEETAWFANGACHNHPELTWFPPPGKPKMALDAIAICNTECSVQTECLNYALTAGRTIRPGIWGGMSAKQRQKYRGRLAQEGTILTQRQCQLPSCHRLFHVNHLASNAKYCTSLHRSIARRQRRYAISRTQKRTP